MNTPDVLVTVEGGVADVQVNKPNIIVEVRDYDVDGVEDDHELALDGRKRRSLRALSRNEQRRSTPQNTRRLSGNRTHLSSTAGPHIKA